MVMRIVVPEARSAGALADRLAMTYGRERISFFGDRSEIAVQVAGESDGAVFGVLESVERWLHQAGLASAEMWLGEHKYRLASWSPEGHPRLRTRARVVPRVRRQRRAASRRPLAVSPRAAEALVQ